MSIFIATIYSLLYVFSVILQHEEASQPPPTKEQILLMQSYNIERGQYYNDPELLKVMVNLSSVNVLETTWITGKTELKRKQHDSFFNIDLDANQWWLHASVTTDSDLSFIKKQCTHKYTLQMQTISPLMEISKLTDSPLFNGNKNYKIYAACTLFKSPLTAGIVAVDEDNGVLLMLMETFS